MAATTTSGSEYTRHFPGRHYEGAASGPFAALNPTVRRFPLAATPAAKKIKDDEQQPSGDDDAHGNDADAPKGPKPAALGASEDEVRADDVQRQWRSRDNRKGRFRVANRIAASID